MELESGIGDLRILCGKFLTATSEVVSNMLFPIFVFGNNKNNGQEEDCGHGTQKETECDLPFHPNSTSS